MSGDDSTDGGGRGAAASLIVAGAAGRRSSSSPDDDVGVRVDDAGADDAPPEIGSWWWVSSGKSEDEEEDRDLDDLDREYDRPGGLWLACVVALGSNYAQLEGVRLKQRVGLGGFHDKCVPEPNASAFVAERVSGHKQRVQSLMGEIQEVCHRLGVPMSKALSRSTQESSSSALAIVSGVPDVAGYRDALVRAKKETLPELFKKVEAEHEAMAKWMKADLIPAEAELGRAKSLTEAIEEKIQVVELYAGLIEELVCVRDGAPAGMDDKVALMQRRHYMDEECLARYEAGGMDFEDIEVFDRWLSRDESFSRIFPKRRCVVAFRVRRSDKEYRFASGEAPSLAGFIRFWSYNKENERTFLYVRNGDQLWRLETKIAFGAELFPSKEDSDLLGDQELWIKEDEDSISWDSFGPGVITSRRRQAMIDEQVRKRSRFARLLWQWHEAGKPEKGWTYVAGDDEEYANWTPGSLHPQSGRPHRWRHDVDGWPHREYVRLTPESLYHDDVQRRIRRATAKHNRVAVVLQGLLDRSTCLHPHPPWRIWTPGGFAAGVELIYDVSRAISPGEAPDFEAYRNQLNRSLRAGCHAFGQRHAWRAAMEEKHGDRWRSRVGYSNKGPGAVHPVDRVRRDGSCVFRWSRERSTPEWVNDPENPGYRKAVYLSVPCTWTCPGDALTCVDAYTPGDYRLFFDDPRTRADYLRWAPILLTCEDWHAARRDELGRAERGECVEEESEASEDSDLEADDEGEVLGGNSEDDDGVNDDDDDDEE